MLKSVGAVRYSTESVVNYYFGFLGVDGRGTRRKEAAQPDLNIRRLSTTWYQLDSILLDSLYFFRFRFPLQRPLSVGRGMTIAD